MQNDLNKLAECDKREEMQNDRAACAVHIDTTEISSDRDRVFTICHTYRHKYNVRNEQQNLDCMRYLHRIRNSKISFSFTLH